jgi:hypothetical protein
MMVMRLSDALAITAADGLPPHQVALARGLLHEHTPSDVTLFVSHQVRARAFKVPVCAPVPKRC